MDFPKLKRSLDAIRPLADQERASQREFIRRLITGKTDLDLVSWLKNLGYYVDDWCDKLEENLETVFEDHQNRTPEQLAQEANNFTMSMLFRLGFSGMLELLDNVICLKEEDEE